MDKLKKRSNYWLRILPKFKSNEDESVAALAEKHQQIESNFNSYLLKLMSL